MNFQITFESANVQLRVGVAQSPLQVEDASRWTNTWCIQVNSGDLYCNGEQTGTNLFTLDQGDSLTLEYSVSSRRLTFAKNDGEVKKAFSRVFVVDKDLSPFVYFLNSEGPKKVRMK